MIAPEEKLFEIIIIYYSCLHIYIELEWISKVKFLSRQVGNNIRRYYKKGFEESEDLSEGPL